LGHDAVIGRYYQNGDIGAPRASRAHCRECLMARRVEERDALVIDLNLVGPDVLRDTTVLACCYVRAADCVK
jgi:hypothetical protein